MRYRSTESMLMRKVNSVKQQMIREAVKTNLENPATKVRRKRVQWQLLRWAPPITVVVVTLACSSFVISRRKATPSAQLQTNTRINSAVVSEQTAELLIPQTPPIGLSRSVLPLTVKRIVIDPGHGGAQPGAISKTGLAEKDVTLDIALRLRQLMKQSSFDVLMTRGTDETVTLADRVAFANANKADVFVSIHINWMQPSSIRPLETYYVGPSKDPRVLQLATVENRDSGYSLSQYRQLLDKVYLDVRRNESQALATAIDAELYRSLKPLNPKLNDRGVKMAPFAVLVGTQMPAILAEVSSLSNDEDDKSLKDELYKEKIAVALFNAINRYAKTLNSPGKRGSTLNGTT